MSLDAAHDVARSATRCGADSAAVRAARAARDAVRAAPDARSTAAARAAALSAGYAAQTAARADSVSAAVNAAIHANAAARGAAAYTFVDAGRLPVDEIDLNRLRGLFSEGTLERWSLRSLLGPLWPSGEPQWYLAAVREVEEREAKEREENSSTSAPTATEQPVITASSVAGPYTDPELFEEGMALFAEALSDLQKAHGGSGLKLKEQREYEGAATWSEVPTR